MTNLQKAESNRERLRFKRRGRAILRTGARIVTRSDAIAVTIARGALPNVPLARLKSRQWTLTIGGERLPG